MDATPPSDDLEALAELGRAKAGKRAVDRAAEGVVRERLAAARAAVLDRKARSAVTRALALGAYHIQPTFIVVAALTTLPFFANMLAGERSSTAVVLGSFSALVAIGVAYVWVVIPLAGERQRRWLASLPFGFDLASYEESLTVERVLTAITIRIAFASPPDGAQRALFGDVVAAAADGERGTFEGDELTVSGVVETRFTRKTSVTGSRTWYEGFPVHRWVLRCIAHAVLPIHARAPIASVKVHLTATR